MQHDRQRNLRDLQIYMFRGRKENVMSEEQKTHVHVL